MNKTLQEHIKEAVFAVEQEGILLPLVLEKFAQLIVRECIAIVEPSSYRRAYPENYRGGIDCLELLEERAAKIKEHFGIV